MKKLDYTGVIDYLKEHLTKVLIWAGGILGLLIIVAIVLSWKPSPPPGTQLRYIRSISAFTMGDTTMSIDSLRYIVETAPQTPEGKRALFYLGVYNLNKGNYDVAEDYFKRFLKSGLKDPYMISLAYGHLATVEINKGDLDKGMAYLKKAMDENPYSSYKGYFLYRIIVLNEERGNYKEAYKLALEFEKKYKDHPLYPDVSRELKILKGAVSAES